MNDAEAASTRTQRLEKLLAWVTEGYTRALELYGPTHPLTQSWLKEKSDIEWFKDEEARAEHLDAA